jgi:hypothetical protein
LFNPRYSSQTASLSDAPEKRQINRLSSVTIASKLLPALTLIAEIRSAATSGSTPEADTRISDLRSAFNQKR